MLEPAARPQPDTDLDRRGQHAPHERIALATAICQERGRTNDRTAERHPRAAVGQPWTDQRLSIDGTVKRGASRPVEPPSVYRVLDFLMAQGLISKIESLNACIPCVHRERYHDCLFFICRGCRVSVEFKDPRIAALLTEMPSSSGSPPPAARSRSCADARDARKSARCRRFSDRRAVPPRRPSRAANPKPERTFPCPPADHF